MPFLELNFLTAQRFSKFYSDARQYVKYNKNPSTTKLFQILATV